ncbi:hypothetical protein BT93_J1689 [Corymbia citriodora subsp. variegata]|nr:hypothetical protein BT93_J1689 [Corymbia citriodora subsp. variegata]
MTHDHIHRLCKVLGANNLLRSTVNVSIREQVMVFCHIIGHNVRFRVIGGRFHRSIDTVHRYFKIILRAILKLYKHVVKEPSNSTPPEISNSRRFYPYFKMNRQMESRRENSIVQLSQREEKEKNRIWALKRDRIAHAMWISYQNIRRSHYKANEEKVKQFRWSKPMERVLLEILADEATKGNKPSSTFKPSLIARPNHIENHLKTVKSNWKTIQTLRGKSGFNWDDKLKMVIAGKKEFDEYVHHSHEKYLNKMIDMYDEMALVVGRDMATRSFGKQLGDIDAIEVDTSPIDLGDDFDELMKGSKTSSFTVPSEKRSHKREMASAIKSLGQNNIDPSQVHYSRLYDGVMKMDGYNKVTLGSIFDHLVENEKIGKAFMVKSANLQKVWIDKFLSKGDDHQ